VKTDTTPPENRVNVRIAQAANRLFCRTWHEVKTLAPPSLPAKGPAILVCNHISGLDPMLIQSCSRRLIVWMMAREYYEMKALRWLYEVVEAIPVDRGGRDLAATRAALRALGNGRILGIFPEGKIETGMDLLPFQTGVSLMAIKTGVPVFPAYLEGTQRGKEMLEAVLYPRSAVLRFGPPVEFSRESTAREALEQGTERIKQAVEKQRKQVWSFWNEQNYDGLTRKIL
jgi:1-acyl-sn-glycerol-3-phosphate acyltransferase